MSPTPPNTANQTLPADVTVPSEPQAPRRLMWERSRATLENRRVCSTPLGLRGSAGHPFEDVFAMALTVGVRALGLYRRGTRNALDLRLRKLGLVFRKLPAEFDGYRILHLSDLHLDMLPGTDRAIAEAVQDCDPDICIMTGDYRAKEDGPYEQILEPMARVLEVVKARDGVYATLGNHDDHRMAAAFEDMGIRVLANETAYLKREGAEIHLTGLDDVNRFYTAMADQALTEAPDGFGIVAVHSPEMAEEAAAHGYALYLCGHTHGGQVCFPGGRPIVTRLHRAFDKAAGLWQCGGMVGFTSPGAGTSAAPLRYFSRGEATLVTLRK